MKKLLFQYRILDEKSLKISMGQSETVNHRTMADVL